MAINANTYGALFAKTVAAEAPYRRKASAFVYPVTDVDGIKAKGESISIVGLTNVSWSAITDPFTTSTTAATAASAVLTLDQYYELNKGISNKEIAQVPPDVVAGVAKNATSEMVKMEDAYIYGLYASAGKTINGTSPLIVTAAATDATHLNILEAILSAKAELAAKNVDDMDMILEVSPAVDNLITIAMQALQMPSHIAEDGKTPLVYGIKKLVSSQVKTVSTADKCFLRTARSIAFYEQIGDIKVVDASVSATGHGTKVFGEVLFGAVAAVAAELVCINAKLS